MKIDPADIFMNVATSIPSRLLLAWLGMAAGILLANLSGLGFGMLHEIGSTAGYPPIYLIVAVFAAPHLFYLTFPLLFWLGISLIGIIRNESILPSFMQMLWTSYAITLCGMTAFMEFSNQRVNWRIALPAGAILFAPAAYVSWKEKQRSPV